jgi:hypothetical protein
MANDRVAAVERALTVLEVFDDAEDNFSLAALARGTGFHKSTLLRLLGSLARFGYVRRTGDGTWQLGDTPGRLARRRPDDQDVLVRIEPCLQRVAAQLEETAALLERTSEGVECRLVALPSQALRHDLHPGMRWACANADDPRPTIPGGEMLAVVLPGSQPVRWLAVSGPAGRVPVTRALALLEEAAAMLGEMASPAAVSSLV